MNKQGDIHLMQQLPGESETDAQRRLEKQFGKLMPIPPADLPAVEAMPKHERVEWFRKEERKRKNARKAQRAARKKQRRG